MKTPTKVIVTAAASLLGVALATGGAYAATGSLGIQDAPGQALKVSGVGPASTHASETAKTHANPNAKGLFGTAAPTVTPTPSASASAAVAGDGSTDVSGSAAPTNTASPVPPTVAAKDASTVKGNTTGKQIEAWAHNQSGVQAVAPDAATTAGADLGASVTTGH